MTTLSRMSERVNRSPCCHRFAAFARRTSWSITGPAVPATSRTDTVPGRMMTTAGGPGSVEPLATAHLQTAE